MRLEFVWIWLCVPPLLVYVYWLSRRSYAQLLPAARWGSFTLRLVILLCLVGAISQPVYWSRANHHHLMFVLDVSRSITPENLDAALDDIDRLAREAFGSNEDLQVSLVAFGEHPRLLISSEDNWDGWPEELREQTRYQQSLPELYRRRARLISSEDDRSRAALAGVAKRIARAEQFRDEVAGDHTDIEQALLLALNCGTNAERRTLYIYTDGNINRGRRQRAWSLADDASTTLHAVLLDKPAPPEVAVADLAPPPFVRVNQGFSAKLRVAGTVETAARLTVFKDGYAAYQDDVRLAPGENVLSIPGLYFREKGFHTVEATIRPDRDTRIENNTIRSVVVVPGEARVLYVDADEDQIPFLKSALELEGMRVEARPAAGVPDRLTDLLSFDAFVLSNVPADRLSFRQMQMIRTYVQSFGGGFIMLGGDESFGLGGYFNTPLEEILPVRMPIRKELIRPSLGIMLVIDKSGSMTGVKIQLAKRAALATAEAINPRDRIGVIGFDGESRVILELTAAADRATISSHIASLEAGGGTFLYPALEDAHNRLVESNARKKHVIVLSDGQTMGFGYEELVQMMASDGITLSAVGIGEGADMQLMEAIALAGGGRAYFTNDFYSIPQIFTREALRASRSMLVERLVQPVVVGDDVCLAEIDTDELPLLAGYVATTPKSAANQIIVSDSGDPLLAKWRFGLGRTVAFTSDTKPRWAEDWLEWPDFAKFWSQLVRSVTGESLARSVSIECRHRPEGKGVLLTADVRDATGHFVSDADLELTAFDNAGRSRRLAVARSGPGLFEARLPEIAYGSDHHFAWRLRKGGQEDQTVSYGFVYSFSPEFRTLGPATDVLDRIAARGSDPVMTVGNSRLVLSGVTAASWRPLWPHLMILSLLLVPLDILCRRLG